MIITTSYFLNKLVYIPAAVTQPSIGSNTPTTAGQLQSEIDQREYEVVLSALGYAQAAELFAQFETNGDWIADPIQKWVDLVDGVDYGDGKHWNGLRYTIGTKKISLLAFYTFFYYLQADWATYSTTGIKVAESENSTRQAPNVEQAKAWNTFIQMYGGQREGRGYEFFQNWNGIGMTWGATNNNNVVTLYQFLTDNRAVYDCSFFSVPNGGYKGGIVNTFNL